MKKIIIYTTPTCHYCRMTKDFFHEHTIEYTEKDVAQDLEARKEMVAKSGQLGVPVIDIEGTLVIGFNRDALTELLEIKEITP